MANPNGAKGTAFETSLLPALRMLNPHAIRRGKQGVKDKGDFYLPGEDLFAIEAKNVTRFNLPEWIAEAKQEANNAGVPVAVVISKRRGVADPYEQYVHMTVRDFVNLVLALRAPKTRKKAA